MQDLTTPWGSVHAWLLEGANGPLVLVLLLVLWLWLLLRRREEAARRPRRPEPLSLDELGRLCFQAAMNEDKQLWRDLFVNGAEARALIGDDAVAFLEGRPPSMLDRVLNRLAAELPRGSVFGGIDTDMRGIHALVVRHPDGSETALPLGSSTQIGPVLRLWGGQPPAPLQVAP